PQVPGPGCRRPAPKKVAVSHAQAAAGGPAGSCMFWPAGSVTGVFILVGWDRIRVVAGVRQRWRYHVLAIRPLAEVDQPATLAAEGELGIGVLHRLLADGATQADCAFAGHDENNGRFSDCRLNIGSARAKGPSRQNCVRSKWHRPFAALRMTSGPYFTNLQSKICNRQFSKPESVIQNAAIEELGIRKIAAYSTLATRS